MEGSHETVYIPPEITPRIRGTKKYLLTVCFICALIITITIDLTNMFRNKMEQFDGKSDKALQGVNSKELKHPIIDCLKLKSNSSSALNTYNNVTENSK